MVYIMEGSQMTAFHQIRYGVCIAALFSGTGAMADVTAQQVWDDWQANLGIYGNDSVTVGSEELSGGVLTVTDLVINSDDGATALTATLASLVFTENGDGTVSVTMSDEYPFSATTTPEFGPAQEITGALRQAGMTITVSGTPEEMTYDISADRYAVQVDELTEDGTPVINELLFALNDMAGQYVTTPGDPRQVDYALGAASLDILLDIANPAEDMVLTVSGKIENLQTDAALAMPADAATIEPEQMLAAGLGLAGGYTYDAANYIFSMTQYGAATNGTASAGAGELTLSMDAGSFGFTSSVTGVELNIMGDMMPFPVTVSLAEYGFGLLMPLAKSDTPEDFAALVNLSGLTVNDEIWSILDQGAVLPRDPITAIVDLSGKANLFYDILDPAQADAMAMADVPGELHELTLNALALEVGGASVTGEGGFTFDNSDMMTIPGFPRPEGEVNLEINGLNGLLDKLVQMGLIPEDQLMMPRMMLGMFATTVGPDQLTSKIEVNEEGHIIANGQRIQ